MLSIRSLTVALPKLYQTHAEGFQDEKGHLLIKLTILTVLEQSQQAPNILAGIKVGRTSGNNLRTQPNSYISYKTLFFIVE